MLCIGEKRDGNILKIITLAKAIGNLFLILPIKLMNTFLPGVVVNI